MNVAALLCACGLAAVYAFGDRLERRAEKLGHRRWLSFAAGVSVAYVFVDVLPELALHNKAVVESQGRHVLFGEQRIYGLALVAFVLLYGLDHLVSVTKRSQGEAEKPLDFVGTLQVAGFAVYNWLIGYLLVERAEKGPVPLTLYMVAMGLHFLIIDHSLLERHGRAYRHFGRWILAASVPLGCLAGSLLPISEVTFARLFAFIAGGMVMTSAQSELPTEREGRFWPFCVGAVVYAILLLAT